jgi:hypothetical protein
MIVSQNRVKVKKKAYSLISKLDTEISKPIKKFILEMSFGMLMTGSSNTNLIAGKLKESEVIRHTLKRLQRMLLHSQILRLGNKLSLGESQKKISSETILALDGGDISHQYGKKFEKSAKVKDGSSGELRKGYWLNQVSGYNPSTRETFPILLYIYSVLESGFKSANTETFKIVECLIAKIGNLGLWVIDRGYDGGEVLNYFLSRKLNFMLRMKTTRNVIFRGNSVNINKLAKKINRRIKYNDKARFGSCKVQLELKKKRYDLTLICYKDKRNKKPIIFLTNDWIKSTKELKRRIRGYFYRWGVEECYRFEKQGFGIEKSKTRNYERIKTLLGLTIISWLILIKVNEQPKLKEAVLKEAKMEKNKIKNRPKFIYYRLHRGIQNLFEGVKRLFYFRAHKKEKLSVISKIKDDYPLFKKIKYDNLYWEAVA